ncbi:MAG: type I secretion system permease/ATPase [Sulfuricellaceae bacterium]|nr:type I secretion system permease/ATPase [Sulfuricellaceae bacterium]
MNADINKDSWHIPPGIQLREDPLLNCLVVLTKLWNKPFSPDALVAGLPLVGNRLTPELFLRAAWRGGLSSKIVNRKLEAIPELVLPVILLLQDKQACILVKKNHDGTMQVIQPETGVGTMDMTAEQLNELYTGHAIYAKPAFRFEDRVVPSNVLGDPNKWFWNVLLESWPIYADVIVASLLINALTLATYFYAINVFDRVVPNNAFETLWVLTIGIMLVLLFDMALKILRSYFTDLAGKKADVVLSANIFERMLAINLAEKPVSVGSFMGNMNEFNSLRDFMTSSTLLTFVDLPFIFLYIMVIWWIGGPLAWIPLSALPIGLLVGYWLQGPLSKLVRENVRLGIQKQATLAETLICLEPIKALGAEGPMQSKWENQVGEVANMSLRAHMFSTVTANLSWFMQHVASVAVIVYGVYLVADREITLGALVISWVLTRRALSPLGQIASLMTRYQYARDALRFFDRMMELPVERPAGKPFVSRARLGGKIEFRNVSFNYPGNPEPALNNISFTIQKGERVGIIGRIGSGKTTIEKLILGLYQPSAGAVLIDDIDIHQLDPADLRRDIGYVPQDVVLFYGTVRENIVIAAPYSRDSDMLRAAETSGVSEFIKRNPKGYDLTIGERGESLSGGQKQTIAIARALLRSPPILLFDEPSNSMDPQTERTFMEKLSTTLGEKTLVLVTHHHSVLPLVSRLIVVDDGQVVSDGPKEQILAALAEGKVKVNVAKTK